MSESEIILEPQEQKELRRKMFELALQECDSVQNEIDSWKCNRDQVNSGSQTAKYKLSSIFDNKVEEIQNKLKARKRELPISSVTLNNSSLPIPPHIPRSHLDSSAAHFDQKASIQSSLLTQELYTRQLQLFQEKHTIELKNLNLTISTLTDKLIRLEQESASSSQSFKHIISEQEEAQKRTDRKLLDSQKEAEMLKEKLNESENFAQMLQEKLVDGERSNRELRKREEELDSMRAAFEKERKRREIAESEYKSLIDEVRIMNEKSCEQIRSECQVETNKYKEKARRLEKALKRGAECGEVEGREDLEKVVEDNKELRRTVRFYEEKCEDLTKQLKHWKVKTLAMAERMLVLYKGNS